ncbi:DUF4126 domain-containing protein [soil metagenome]
MSVIEILGIAGSVSLLSGWRLYLCIFVTGLAMRFGVWPLPEHLQALQVLANPVVIGVAGVAALMEFLADKVMWLDSIWDVVHTVVRPLGGAMLALALVDPHDPATQVIAFILGGGASLLTHAAKAGTRSIVNTVPEPFSNVAVSSGEDVASTGLLWLIYSYPTAAVFVAVALAGGAVVVIIWLRRILHRLSRGPASGAVVD